MRVLFVSANQEMLPQPVVPIGVLSVASAARSHGHVVALADLCFESDPHAYLTTALATFGPDIVAIGLRNLHGNEYSDDERTLAFYESLVRTVRGASACPVVLGGSAFSLRPETLVRRLGADHGIVGEGERAFPWLLGELQAGRIAPGILRSASVSAGRWFAVPDARHGSLDELPVAARDLIDPRYFRFNGVDSVQTKRGCAFACAYCDYPDLEGRLVRTRSPSAVADELASCAKTPGVTHAFIVDSVFNVPRSHALEVCREVIARGAPLPWVCYASPVGLDAVLVGAMRAAGCVGVELGSDAGTEAGLERLRKPFGLEQIRRARELLSAHDIRDCHTFVLGAMDETVAEASETLRFVSELRPDAAVFIVFREDREQCTPSRARNREALLELLAREAPKHPGWSVPELRIRFGAKLTRYLERRGFRGPAWLALAGRG